MLAICSRVKSWHGELLVSQWIFGVCHMEEVCNIKKCIKRPLAWLTACRSVRFVWMEKAVFHPYTVEKLHLIRGT